MFDMQWNQTKPIPNKTTLAIDGTQTGITSLR